MNTASRMESCGTRGRIQVSEATADLLRAAGKDSWLEPRPGGVVAKGKGRLTTYFLNLSNGMGNGTSVTTMSKEDEDPSVSMVKEDEEGENSV